MNCHEIHKLFPLYFDSEGGAELQLQISDHLAMCPECKAWFERHSSYESLLGELINGGELIDRGEQNAEFWQRIAEQVRTRAEPRPSRLASRLALPAGLILAACVMATLVAVWFADEQPVPLCSLAAGAHDRYVAGLWPVDLMSESVEEVEQRLRAEAGFPVRCPPQGRGGFRLKGGGVCQLRGQRGAHVVGDVDGHPVSVIVLPGKILDSAPALRRRLSGKSRILSCREGRYDAVVSLLHGHVVFVLGEHDSTVLREILLGYGSHHASIPKRTTRFRQAVGQVPILVRKSRSMFRESGIVIETS